MSHRSRLALFATLLVGVAIPATPSAASQALLTANSYPAVVTGSQEGSGLETNYFEFTPGRRIACSTVHGEATISQVTTTVLVTPHISGCEANGLSITVKLNGCTFEAVAGTTTSATDAHGSINVTCPVGKKIEVSIGGGICVVDVGPQTISGGLTVTNLASGQVTIHVDVTQALHYEDTDVSGIFCPFAGDTTASNGSMVGDLLLTGYKDQGTAEDPVTPGTIEHLHSVETQSIHVK